MLFLIVVWFLVLAFTHIFNLTQQNIKVSQQFNMVWKTTPLKSIIKQIVLCCSSECFITAIFEVSGSWWGSSGAARGYEVVRG